MRFFQGIRQRYIAAVMALLVFLTAAVTWSLIRAIHQNTFRMASEDILKDSNSFKALHAYRAGELHTRARLLATEPRIIAALGTPDIDRATIQFLAEEIRADGDLDFLMLKSVSGWRPAVCVKGAMADASNAGESWWKAGLPTPGDTGDFRSVAGRDVFIVSAPVTIAGDIHGELLVGDFVRETQFEFLKPMVHADVILCDRSDSGEIQTKASSMTMMSEEDMRFLMDQAREASDRPVEIEMPSTGESCLYRAVALNGRVWALFIKSLEPAKSAIARAIRLSIAIAVGFLFLSSIVVSILTRAVTRPIVKLVEGTESLTAGNFKTRTEIGSPEELRRLSQSFNAMAKKIEELIAAEEKAKAGLEDRVRERTSELAEVNRLLIQAHQELKDQTAKMIQFEKLAGVGTLAAGVAHELNNPLLVVLGNIQILHEQVTDPRVAKKTEVILRHARRCADIVKNMLRFSRQEGPQRSFVDIHRLIDSAVEMARIGAGFEHITIEKDYEERFPRVPVDGSLMEQVFLNIATNAMQAIRDGRTSGIFRIQTKSFPQKIRIRFIDNGHGMPPEIARKIFDPFFTTKIVGQGTGMGLSVAHGIVLQHGGIIFVESSGPSGTVITVELPTALDSEMKETAADVSCAPDEIPSQGRRILLVDDEVDIREIIRSYLENDGWDVVEAESGEHALTELESNPAFNVLLLDIRMPGMDGIELHRIISSRFAPLTRRLIFVTGDTLSPEIRTFIHESGCESIIKPFKMQELLSACRRILRKPKKD